MFLISIPQLDLFGPEKRQISRQVVVMSPIVIVIMVLIYGGQNPKISLSVVTDTREKCPNTEFFLVRIFLYSDWIRTEYVFSPNTGKHVPEKTPYLDTFHAMWAMDIISFFGELAHTITSSTEKFTFLWEFYFLFKTFLKSCMKLTCYWFKTCYLF